MRTFFTFLLGIAAIAIIIMGNLHWHQIQAASNTATSTVEKQAPAATDQTSQTESSGTDLMAYTSKWPKTAADRFKQTIKENKPFKILFLGSPAIGTDTTGTYSIVKNKLIETYGAKHIEVSLKTYKTTSAKFINNNDQKEIAAEKADLIVFEPFILLNNGIVLINDTLQNITRIISDVQAINPETTFILQPSYPLYQAKIYPAQVAELKTYAANNHIAYLNHWSAWPDSNTAAMKEYLTPDQSAPSEKGIKVWSDFLINYLISK